MSEKKDSAAELDPKAPASRVQPDADKSHGGKHVFNEKWIVPLLALTVEQ